jgi:preprotein translocase subunit SecG
VFSTTGGVFVFYVLLVLLLLDGALMGVIVLLQAGKCGGLAAMGGSGGTMADSLIGGRQAATLLTKATWVTGGIFMGLALVLSVMSSRSVTPRSILEPEFQQPTPIAPPVENEQGTVPSVPGTEPATPPPPPPTTTSGN